MNAAQRFGQQCIEVRAQDVLQHGLPQRFGFDCLVSAAAVLVAAIALLDGRQIVLTTRSARAAWRVLSSIWPPEKSRSPR